MRALTIAVLLLAPMAAAALGPAALPAPEPPLAVLHAAAAAGGLDLPWPDIALLRGRALRAELLQAYTLGGVALTPPGLARLEAGLAALPPGLDEPVAEVLAAMNVARLLHARALADVSAAELAWAREATLRGAPQGAEDAARLAALQPQLDLPLVAAGGALLLAAVQDALPRLRLAAAQPGLEDFAYVDPAGMLELSGTGESRFTADRQLQVDLGGDDAWANNAGGAVPQALVEAFPGCAVTGSAECTLLDPSRNAGATRALLGRPCSAAAGETLFGLGDAAGALAALLAAPSGWAAQLVAGLDPRTGCLPGGTGDLGPWLADAWRQGVVADADAHFAVVGVDLAGDDTFAPPRTFNFMNNGQNPSGCDTTMLGDAGRLWDRNVTAGAAFASLGLLWDAGGSDAYGGRSITQGAAHVGAFAALVDQGDGADRYEAVRFAQGLGFFGALGLLLDEGGHDVYRLRNLVPLWNEFEPFTGCDVSTRDGQGRSNFDAIGALVDGAGDDAYDVQDHLAEGLVLPGAGRDDPTTTQGSTGFRLGLGPTRVQGLAALGRGLLWDRGGADAYSRPGRGDGCADTGGTFLDQAPGAVPSLAPCPP